MCCATNLLLTLICISIFSFFASGAVQNQHEHAHGGGCIPADRAALLSFKKGITSDNANRLASWHGLDCCRWRGISCSNRTGHVIKLHLHNPDVTFDPTGFYDAYEDANALFGEISPSLLSLKHLEHLDLSMNCLLGPNNQVPHLLGSMGNLRYLNLSGIPYSTVECLLSLVICLSCNVYSTDITWLRKLSFLKFLSMRGITLKGIADWPHTLNMVPSLRIIDLSACSLDSANQSLPHLNLTKLEKLDLSWNYFEHSLGSCWFWKATSLNYLDLGWNLLFGKFPDTLENMTSLQVLDVSHNWNVDLMMTGKLKTPCSLEIIDLSDICMNGVFQVLLESLPQCTWKKLKELDLSSNNITGTLPNFISDFMRLSILSLSINNLVGPIPPQIGNLTCLTSLDLSNNHLNGNIPPELGALTTLTYLDISINDLTGCIPPELGNLRFLTTLYLRANKIAGPVPPHLGNLTYLTYLELSYNHLTGSIPAELGNLMYLTALDLSNNNITAPIPPELMHSTSLAYLDLSNNHLNGSVPTEIGSLINLIYLDLRNNRFIDWCPPFTLDFAWFRSCQIGPLFPPWLQRLKTNALDISSNALKGEIPDWFWPAFSNATYMDISNNQISGSLPTHLDGMAFDQLYLSSNRLTGPIPTLPINITLLDISNNTFSETIPSNLEASQLEVLCMHSNQIGGYIPESICKLEQLKYLDLSNNNLEGGIPQCPDIHNIEYLILSNNSLSGKIPALLENNTRLQFLDLAWNNFSGRLPTWIWKLANLRFLILSHNKFSDSIPVDVTKLVRLQYLDLSGNRFFGAIPCHLSNLTFRRTLQEEYMDTYDLLLHDPSEFAIGIGPQELGQILSVNTKGQHLIYHRTLEYFVGIDLSCNSLTGEIPTDITSLDALVNLNLSSNQLSGQIPNMIGAMQSLESLDLSQNKLSGEIPSSLSNLTSLSYLDLSYNSLSGRIPSGPQLDTLSAENQSLMYIGNSGLCGPPVHKNCSGNDPSIRGDLESSKAEFEPLTFYFGLVLGFVVGLWMVFCALLFKKTWRIACFRLFDEVYDQVYVFVVVKWASFAKKIDED
ncbi:LRR receptor-like serine/threonine-protein kinase GSO1 [Triticum urartu]|uniref:LRR receptor-like serine/threonine-protein kinase GSO1 n=1 Tax=Triticum urartu TaxID=4572 RepID=M7ZAN6_TRIUA|nr:LRR receptor-like serine/threonine-protein kinase GSO1 [Triticum urartu]